MILKGFGHISFLFPFHNTGFLMTSITVVSKYLKITLGELRYITSEINKWIPISY